jgi:hypothetical protein
MNEPTDDEIPERCPILDSRNLTPEERQQALQIIWENSARDIMRITTVSLRVHEAAYASQFHTYQRSLATNGGDWKFQFMPKEDATVAPASVTQPPAAHLYLGIPEPAAPAPAIPPKKMTLDELIDLAPPIEPSVQDGSIESLAKDFPLIFGDESGLTREEQYWALAAFFPTLAILNEAPIPPGFRYEAKIQVAASVFLFFLRARKDYQAKKRPQD